MCAFVQLAIPIEIFAMMTIEKLLEGLMVNIQPFVICRTIKGPKLDLPSVEFATLHYVVAGSGNLRLSGKISIGLEQGTIVIMPPGMAHEIIGDADDDDDLDTAKKCLPLALGMDEIGTVNGEGGIVVACSSINATYMKVHGLFDYLSEPIVNHAVDGEAIGGILKGILKEMANPQPGSNALLALMMKQCLIYVLRQYCESGNCQVPWLTALNDPQLSKTLELMIDEPGHRFTLEILAEHAGMSRSAFAERFKSAFGRPAMDFLKELRLQRAAHLLRTSNRPIKSIADQVGFESRSHFSRSFTNYFDTSPAEFRDSTLA